MKSMHRSPLVVGYPRTGFSLLVNVLGAVGPYAPPTVPAGSHFLRTYCDVVGERIASRIETVFDRRGLRDRLLFNGNFRQMAGGPKWLRSEDVACFRKYIGVRGRGDFTLITSHPRQVLDYHEIVHSHAHPALWATHPAFSDRPRFASIRHPAGTLASACFSLNALASEYIQRFLPPDRDNDQLRQALALYKLTDLNFFEALLGPFKAYLEEFETCRDRFQVMRWEDLIESPAETMRQLVKHLGGSLDAATASGIWAMLDHVNLTANHRHNLRVGHGVVGGWRRWLTNEHLQLIRDRGIDRLTRAYGYDLSESLDPAAYAPFQAKVARYLARGEVCREYEDEDLFGFAFNKTNLDLSRFAFKRYAWREHTQVERSTCSDDALVKEVWDAAEHACAAVNRGMAAWIARAAGTPSSASHSLAEEIMLPVRCLFDSRQAADAAQERLTKALVTDRSATEGAPVELSAPILLRSVNRTNIVLFGGRYYAVPQSLGPVDFQAGDVSARPGVKVAGDLGALLAGLGAS